MAHEAGIRTALFAVFFITFALIEVSRPFYSAKEKPIRHWSRNLMLIFLGTPLLRLFFPVLAVGAALLAQQNGWGLLNQFQLHPALHALATILVMDFAIYFQHRIFHAVPWLWRLHRVHHTDRDFDVSTGVRFHPVEIALSMGIKVVTVFALGASPLGVLIFEILLNATALFTHANFRLPRKWDTRVRRLLVTPDMHRVHHSIHRQETDSNFGFNFSFWDRLFRTYKTESVDGDRQIFGVEGFVEQKQLGLLQLLIQPLKK